MPRRGSLLYVSTRRAWRAWLARHHRTAREIWLVFYKKHTGKPRISYNDAVEEALCYGWIDSTAKTVDTGRYAQRFTPRKSKGKWSEMNKERARRLIRKGKMTAAGLAALGDALGRRRRGAARSSSEKAGVGRATAAPDVIRALKRSESAWKNFQAFPQSYKRIRIGWIEAARKRPEVFRQRLRYFVKMTRQNKRFGMVQ